MLLTPVNERGTITRIFFFLVRGHTADDYLLGARGGPGAELLQGVRLRSSHWNRKGKKVLDCRVQGDPAALIHDT